jgi:NTP pyrophosphatase (non-canonical NTP hydrolase)
MSTPTEIINEPTVFVSGANRVMLYSDFVDNLFKSDTKDMEYMHAALGVAGEAGELADAIKKHVVYGKELDRNNIVEELGDLRFYMQQLMNMIGISEEEVLQGNATKLGKRYKTGSFSQEQAIARADKQEEELKRLEQLEG